MEPLIHATNRLVEEIKQGFVVLNNRQCDEAVAEAEIQTKINTVNANCDRLDVLVFKVPPTQRQTAKMRADQIKYDIRHLQAALTAYYQKKQRRELEKTEREQLLNRRFAPNSDTTIDLDYSLQHHNSMKNAHSGVDDMLNTGGSVLDSLRNQRETLKGARKRMLDIGNTLGLSNHTMRMIEKRMSEDKLVFYGGAFLTLLIIFLVIYFFLF